ncbi:flavodoxin family protein [Mycoplasmatota bacterium]|nr:flavodoxin family protein [Mycoplasmatota bacterium]
MILVLTGSPNRYGNTNSVVNTLLNDISDEIIYYNAYDIKISSCTDCKICSYKSGCKVSDEMSNIYRLLERADTLIIASPLYFATLTGELVNLISRFQTFFAGKYIRKDENPQIKKGLFIVTAGGYWESMFVGVKETFKIIKLLFNFEETKELFIPNCDKHKPLEDDFVINQIKILKEFIND